MSSGGSKGSIGEKKVKNSVNKMVAVMIKIVMMRKNRKMIP